MFWVTGDAVEVADCLEDEEVMEAVTGMLRRVTGDLALPFPDRLIRSVSIKCLHLSNMLQAATFVNFNGLLERGKFPFLIVNVQTIY